MEVIALCCTRQSRAPHIDRCAPEIWLWPWSVTLTLTLRQWNSDVKTRYFALDLELWPTTLTYNPNIAKVKLDLHTKYQGSRSNCSGVTAMTDRQMDGRYQAHYLPASLSYAVDEDLSQKYLWTEVYSTKNGAQYAKGAQMALFSYAMVHKCPWGGADRQTKNRFYILDRWHGREKEDET